MNFKCCWCEKIFTNEKIYVGEKILFAHEISCKKNPNRVKLSEKIKCKNCDKMIPIFNRTGCCKTCSLKLEERRESFSKRFSGENNPNFGNKWSEEKKKIQGEKIKNAFETIPGYRERISETSKGRKWSEEAKEKWKKSWKKSDLVGKSTIYTKEIREKIGTISSKRFEDEVYKNNIVNKGYETKVKNGTTIPIEERKEFKIFRDLANWTGNTVRFLTEEEIALINEISFFHPVKNINGLTRDHKFSRYEGFRLKVFPNILRHPVNCQLLSVSENAKKGNRPNSGHLTLEELFNLIENYDKEWEEQNLCIELINKYRNGFKWEVPKNFLEYRNEKNIKGAYQK